ncbi:MAG: PEGA domain-containing protein [Deltaproteobacteria bacterium]
MSLSPRRRAPLIASLALVSILHTSLAAWAQAPATAPGAAAAGSRGAGAQGSGAASPSSANSKDANASAAADLGADAAMREQARAAYGAGQEAYAAGQYAAAEAHFARADSLLPAIQAKYWRAMSLDKLGDVAGASSAFGLVLSDAQQDDLGAEKLAAAAARQRELSTVPSDLLLTTTPAGAHVQVSGVEVPSPTPLSLRLVPGRHELLISLPGYQSQRLQITATPGAKLRPSLTLLPQAPVAAAPSPTPATDPSLGALGTNPNPARSQVPGFVTLGIAGASAVVGTIFGIRALSDKKDYDDAPSTKRADDVERNALIADMAFGVTLTLGITGLVLLVADDSAELAQSRPSQAARLHIAPYVSPRGAGAAAALRF